MGLRRSTSNALVLCQYQPTPGHHGSVLAFYARIADIAVGVIYCLLIDLIWPWSVSYLAPPGKVERILYRPMRCCETMVKSLPALVRLQMSFFCLT